MSALPLFLGSLLATVAAFVVPGWPLARRIAPDTTLLASAVLSLATLFVGALALSVVGLRIAWTTLLPFQLALFGAGFVGRGNVAVHANANASDAPRPSGWLIALAGIVLATLLARAWLQPLPGYDTCFRWERLARLIFATGGLDYYPARTAADYALYFYPDSVPPLVSLAYTEIFSLVGGERPEATAWFVTLQAVLLGSATVALARRWGGAAAGQGAWLGLCATPLLFWCVLMGQETGLTAIALAATLLWLEQAAAERSDAAALLAGLATAIAALSREYGGAFALVGLVAAAGLRLGVRRTALYLGAVIVVAAPWYVRVWLLTGSPVYPLRVGSLFAFNAVHAAAFDELRLRFSWSVLPHRERLRLLFQLFQLAPLALVGGAAGLWLLRRRAPWAIAALAVVVALWLYGMGVVAGGGYISLRMLSPALALLAAASGVALARLGRRRLVFAFAGIVAGALLPNLATMPLMAKSVGLAHWLDAFTPARPRQTAETSGERAIIDLPGKILTDDPYVHSWIADRGAGAKVVPLWSPEFAFLFDATLPAEEQLRRLAAHDVRTVVIWPGLPASAAWQRLSWAQRIRDGWTTVAPGYHHLPPVPAP